MIGTIKRLFCMLAIALSVVACTEEIDESNRYTFTGETMADFLLNRSDRYSHFINLLKRAELFSLLQTYGQYTLFLPDNASLEKYIAEQDSIYHATEGTPKFQNTGITSPLVDELSDSMANVIARMHLIERNYHMADFGEGAIGKWNFNDKALVISYNVVDEQFYIMLNNCSAIVDGDNEVENGIVHIIDKPIDTKHVTIANHIMEQGFFQIFSRAVAETGYVNAVSDYIDHAYKFPEELWDYYGRNKNKYIKYTAFVESDEVYNANGIYNLDDLVAFAEKWYGTEDRGDYRSPRNALYRFVAYHFVEGELAYNRLVPTPSGAGQYENSCIPGFDLYNYFTTMYGKLLKVLKPLSKGSQNVYINYSKREIPYNFEMRKHLNVRVIELTEFLKMRDEYATFNPVAANGIIHPIDKILIYNDDEMAGNILNERMRFAAAALLPELSSNNIWLNREFDIPGDFCKNLQQKGSEKYLCYIQSQGYNCDVLFFINRYDWAFKLPPVPSRTYEIRINAELREEPISRNYEDNRMQVYLDDKICDLPVNFDLYARDERVGWRSDAETYDNGAENDKQLRNKGWMKAPDSFIKSKDNVRMSARDNCSQMRKIITTKYLSEGEHWLRFRNLSEDPYKLEDRFGVAYYDFNYIELVPLRIISDPTRPEDRH